jgi:serine/threonine-protein kinase
MSGRVGSEDPAPAGPLTPERWRVVDSVVQAALERAPAERAGFLARACGSDAALRHEVESLLAAVVDDDFLERAAPGLPAFDPGGSGPTGYAGRDATGGIAGPPGAPPAAFAAALAGRYVIERELGRGGMATVYLARDPRHGRPVAVKVLHPELSAALGPERFLREIAVTASLQHPHILPLFDSGEAAGRLYYVMPYVDGETLRARLAREGPLAVGEALRLVGEAADALAYAHARGVVHRDVKPENVLLQGREHPHALVADFGIALAVEQAGGARMTRTGLSLGTPQYMAPEQAAGERAVDARADVYALGAVLYEMLAGEPPFTGPTARAVVARALTEAPRPLAAQRPSVPPHVDAAVLTALAKLPADRFASAAAFAGALAAAPAGPGTAVRPGGAAVGGAPRRAGRAAAVFGAGALAGAALVAALGWARGRSAAATATGPNARQPVRFTIELDSASLRFGSPAISPDGRTVVYAVAGADGTRLYARQLADLTARPLAGTEHGDLPFFSPDGAWVAFYSSGALRKVRLDGGAPAVVTRLPHPASFGGGSWGPDDVIVYAGRSRGALYRVSASGGTPSSVAGVDTSLSVLHPHLLPGGRAAFVTTTRDYTAGRVAVLDFATGRLRQFGPGVGARYVAGNLVYVDPAGDLYRQPFDLRRLEPAGAAERIATGLDASAVTLSVSTVAFDASPGGALVYRGGASPSVEGALRLVVADRAGRELRAIPARVPWAPRLSPDGRRVAYGAFAAARDSSDVWLTDLATGATQRLTTDGHDNNDPHWSPDGRAVAYSADAPGGKDLLVQPLGGGPARRYPRAGVQWPSDWSADGRTLLFTDMRRATADEDVWAQPLDGGPARPYVATPTHERAARVSPDGRWVAYESDETGRWEVYVQSFPEAGRKTLVSVSGGVNPVWRGDGRELYYWRADQLVAARVEEGAGAGDPLAVRGRAVLFRAPYFQNVHAMYDASRDGARFVLVTGGARAGRLVVAVDAVGADRGRRR